MSRAKRFQQLVYPTDGSPPFHYLYLARRFNGDSKLRICRWKIDQNGIHDEETSQNDIAAEWWNLGISASSITLTQNGNLLAMSNRNQYESTLTDIILFDAHTI